MSMRAPMSRPAQITAADTGTFEIFDEQYKPGFESRLHARKSFKVCYVIDGSGEFQLGDEVFHAQKGACVNIPPGVPHKVGSKAGMRMLMVYSPPGLEGMMKAMKALSAEQLADGALTSRLLAEHDTVVLGRSTASKGYGSVLGWHNFRLKQQFVTGAILGWVDRPAAPGRNGPPKFPPKVDDPISHDSACLPFRLRGILPGLCCGFRSGGGRLSRPASG